MQSKIVGLAVVVSGVSVALAQSGLALTQRSAPVATDVAVLVASPSPKPWMDEKALEGAYYFGDGLGVNCLLELKENRRFSFRWTGCVGVYDRNTGRWEWEGQVMVFKPEHKNATEGFSGMNVRFIPVAWGQRVYLVDEYELPGFCAGIKRLTSRDLHGLDFVKVGKSRELSPLSGEPRVPARYQGACTGHRGSGERARGTTLEGGDAALYRQLWIRI